MNAVFFSFIINIFSFILISITVNTIKYLTVQLHPNAKTDTRSLEALVKVLQFRPELTSIIVSGVVAQIEYSKTHAKIQTKTEKKIEFPAQLKA